jgi:hypothetical protein
MKNFFLLVTFLISSQAATNSLINLGELTVDNGVTWKDSNTVIRVKEYRVYIAETNNVEAMAHIATVTTNRWPGHASTNVHGMRAISVTAVSEANLESGFSTPVLIEFVAGVPKPVSDMQLYQVLRLAATNPLPVAPKPSNPGMPEPNPPVVERFRGPEWAPSKYQK